MLTDAQRQALAQRLHRVRAEAPVAAPRADQIPRWAGVAGEVPMSAGQEQLWFLDRFAPGPTYNIPMVFGLAGPLDAAGLERALTALTARHEALRTRLTAGASGNPVQVIGAPAAVPLVRVDWPGLPAAEHEARLASFVRDAASQIFDLAAGPLLRVWLVERSGTDHLLVVVVHHAVFDGWSAGVFLRDLAALYQAEVTGQPSGLPELGIQFADYARWEHDQLAGPALATHTAWWQQALADCPSTDIPASRPRPPSDDFRGALAMHTTRPGLLPALRELSRGHGTTVYVTLLTGVLAVLHRYTRAGDLVIGTVSARRGRRELDPIIGFLVNTLPIRADLAGDPPFAALLDQVKRTTLDAYAHQDLPFARIVDALNVARDPSRHPVFQAMFTFADHDDRAQDGPPPTGAEVAFTTVAMIPPFHPAKFDLDFHAEARDGGLRIGCCYKTALFDPAPMAALLEHLEILLTAAARDPGSRLSALPLLTAAERDREITTWNSTAASFPGDCIHQAFETQAARTPHAIAACCGDQAWTYAELNRRANQIARRLGQSGLPPGTLAGVCLPASLDRLATLLAIFKAGGAYVPLDPALPPARLAFMITDTGMPVIITDTATAASLPATTAALIHLDREDGHLTTLDRTNLATDVTPASLAYVLYTSGSTGQPKGVLIEHRNVTNFLHGVIRHWPLGPRDAVLQHASLSFDASAQEMFLPLLSGGRVVIAPDEARRSPPELAALIRSAGVTFAYLTPSVLALLAGEDFPSLRILSSIGEELPTGTARAWIRPGLRLANDYGPTEITFSATFMELDAGTGMPPPIGWPKPNYTAYILDDALNPMPAGATGELHIGGAGVARGYLNRPELTDTRFIPDPFTPGGRLYKTGDLARRRPDGAIMFAGRNDTQIKINGQRIETGEIEATLTTCPGIAQALVTPHTTPAGDTQLTAYLRAQPGSTPPGPAGLRTHLAATLPAAMIPAHYITLTDFPRTTNGKIDRAALPAPEMPAAAHPEPPLTILETLLTSYYATVLNLERVSPTQSFFDIGGNSIAAMRFITLLRARLGIDLSVTAVFLHPTPRELAARIDEIKGGAGAPASAGPVIKLNGGPGAAPLFLIHAIGGTVSSYLPLAGELAGTFEVHGLEAPGLSGPAPAAADLGDLVSDYIELIRAQQPEGPYHLGGWSLGGVLAYEIAARLEQTGHHVGLVALLDAAFAMPGPAPSDEQLTGAFRTDVALSLGWDPADLPDPGRATASEQLDWLAARLGDGPAVAGDGPLQRRLAVFRAHTRLITGYQAGQPARPPVHAPAVVAGAGRSPNAPSLDQWPGLFTRARVTRIDDADHYTLLQLPHARRIAAAIERAHQDAPAGRPA